MTLNLDRPLLLDLFCKAGGAARGYHDAGFDVVGVDWEPQPHFPYRFIQADALEYLAAHGGEYDAFHASPPCQFFSVLTGPQHKANHPNYIPAVRNALRLAGRPCVIENVAGARRHLTEPVMLCGSMFGLGVRRHRFFECSHPPLLLPPCDHSGTPVLVSGVTRRKGEHRRENSAQECREAMGIDWMTRAELDEAIPPAYTLFLGRHLKEYIQ